MIRHTLLITLVLVAFANLNEGHDIEDKLLALIPEIDDVLTVGQCEKIETKLDKLEDNWSGKRQPVLEDKVDAATNFLAQLQLNIEDCEDVLDELDVCG